MSFLSPPRLGACLVAAASLSSIFLGSKTVLADDLKVQKDQLFSLSGEQLFETVEIAGTVKVNSYSASDASSGWLHIKAHTITISTTGVIDASGAGYRGEKTGGQGPGAGGTVVPGDLKDPTPGGGGAHSGNGGDGTMDPSNSCTLLMGAEGGTAYDTDPMMPLGTLGLGSAGGASYAGAPNENQIGPGGNGGGVVILEAATIKLDGTILADGNAATNFFGTGPGGGAGGSVIITANSFTFGDDTALSAKGGSGGLSGNDAIVGGGGSGGLIVLTVPGDISGMQTRILVTGGASPHAACTVAPSGETGIKSQLTPSGCVDADGDTHGNEDCMGADDCNDGDPTISPSAPEKCNGIDDNCNDEVDEQLEGSPSLCPQGSNTACVDGKCVEVVDDGGVPDAGTAGAPQIELRGGLCRVGTPGAQSQLGRTATVLFSLLGAALVALGLRRREH